MKRKDILRPKLEEKRGGNKDQSKEIKSGIERQTK